MPNEIDFIPDKNTNYNDKNDLGGIGQRIFNWTVGPGKKVIIFVEALIVLIFISRFKLDEDLSKIKKEIDIDAAIISHYKEDEVQLRNTQYKINKLKEIEKNKFDWEYKINQIQSKVPNLMKIEKLDIAKNKTTLSAKVKDAPSFGIFIHELINDKNVKSITLTSSTYNIDDKQYEFTMNIVPNQSNEKE